MSEISEQRADLCLYHLRFFKTRSLAQEIIGKGRVRVNGEKISKAARKIRAGDVLVFPQGERIRTIEILDFVPKRVGAPIAQTLYRDME